MKGLPNVGNDLGVLWTLMTGEVSCCQEEKDS